MNELEKLFDTASSDVFPSLDVIVEGCDEASVAFDTYGKTCVQAQVLSNNILRDYELNCKQIQLKCYTEGGTDDDISFYEEKASKGAVGKLKAIFDKIITLWQDIVRKVKAIITTKVCSATAKTAVKKMKKTLDTNPKLKTIKVKAPSITTALSVIEGFRKKCNIESTQYVKTLTGTAKVKSIGGLVEDFQKSFGKAIVGKAAVCTLTLAGLILAIETEMDKLPTILEEVDLRETTIIKRLGATVSEDVEVGAAAAFQQAANFRVQLGKQELETHCRYLHDMVQTAKDSINQALTGKMPIDEDVSTSGENRMLTVEEYFGQEEPFDESAHSDARDILKDCKKRYTLEMKEIDKLARHNKFAEARKHCSAAIQTLDAAEVSISSIKITTKDIAVRAIAEDAKAIVLATAAVSSATGVIVTAQNKRSLDAFHSGRAASSTVGDPIGIGGTFGVITAAITALGSVISKTAKVKHEVKKGSTINEADPYLRKIREVLLDMRKVVTKVEKECERLSAVQNAMVVSEDVQFEGYNIEDSDGIFNEGANLDARRIFKSLDKETAKIGKDISNLVRRGAYAEASKRCDELLRIMDSAESQILALDVTPGSIAFGIVVQYLISTCKVALSTLLIVCAGATGGAIGGMISTLFSGSPANLGAAIGMSLGTSVAAIPAQLNQIVMSLVEIVKTLSDLLVTVKKRPDNTFAAADLYINTFIGAIARSRNAIYQIQKDCDNRASGNVIEDVAEIPCNEDVSIDDLGINAIIDSIM